MSMANTKKCREALTKEKQPSKTKQSFAKEADVNLIVKRMESGQLVPDFGQGQFADITGLGDLAEMMRTVTDAKAAFLKLPPEVRARFKNDPRQLVAFLEDDENRKEAETLGLIKAPPPQAPKPVEAVPAAPAAPAPASEPKKEVTPPKT